jgi:hypothetical protein
MNDFDDVDVRTTLQREVDRLNVPAPPVNQLLTGGRAAARARRMRIAVGTAAAVVSVAVGGAVLAQSGVAPSQDPVGPANPTRSDTPTPTPATPRPKTVAELPPGDPPRLPFVVADTMYYARVATSLEQGPVTLRYGGNGAVVMRTQSTGAIHALDDNGIDMRMVTENSSAAPVVSATGDLVAWRTSDAGGENVIVADLATGKQVASLAAPEGESAQDWKLVGIDNRNNVFAASPTSVWMWYQFDSEPEPVAEEVSGRLVEVATEGLLFRDDRDDDGAVADYAVGILTKNPESMRSTVLSVQERIRARYASLSLDGTQIAFADTSGDLWVRSRSGGSDRQIMLPEGIDIAGLVWETDNSLLVATPDGPGENSAWVRCYVDTGNCELPATPTGFHELAER